MRILFITHYDNMYGANRALYHLIRSLKLEFHHEPMLVIPAEGEMTKEMEAIGVKTFISPVTQWQAVYSTPLRFAVKRYIRRKALLQEVENLYQLLSKESIQVIHSNSSVIGTGALLAQKLGCRHIWHIREFSLEHFHMKYFWNRKVVEQLYSQADCLITISDSLMENYQRKYPKAKIVRIYDGVRDSMETPKVDVKDKVVRFCYMGYLFPMKHQLEVLEACRVLNDSGYSNYELVLVGDGKEDYKKKLQAKIERYHLKQVTMAGYVEDTNALLNQMNVGIIASEYEGFGLVTVEYMLHQLPVIGYQSGGTQEIIVDGITGCLYQNPEGLVAAMKYFMENPSCIEKMGRNGRQRAITCFSEQQNASQIANIYAKLEKGAI